MGHLKLLPGLLSQPTYVLGLSVLLPLVIFLIISVKSYYHLSHIPGPFFARFTNIPRLLWVKSFNAHRIHIDLHKKYGPIVRFGPNMVSVGDPREIGTIYSFKKPWPKSDFYRSLLLKTRSKPVEGIFATQNEAIHRALKRPISNVYSMSHLVSFEPYVDTAMRVFCEQLESRFAKAESGSGSGKTIPCDFGQWLQMFAFDVMGELTFSHRFGFMEKGEDIDGVMAELWSTLQKTALVTQMPWLGDVWTNNPILRFFRKNIQSPGVIFAMRRVQERQKIEKGELKKEWKINNRDMLSRFMEVEANDTSVPPFALLVWTSSNITAGSDSTAMFLRAMFYYLLHNPSTLKRLIAEFDAAAEAGNLDELAGFRQAKDLPYFNACINEAGRMHPPLGLPMERVIPAEGANICGQRLEGGTVVGMSSWVTHHHEQTFGADCDKWRPERWLCEPEQAKYMEKCLLTFGAGHRNCIGKNIALLEIYKIVPTLLRRFHFELLDPDEGGDWVVTNRWFVTQRGFKVRLRRRVYTES
ncbi:benzoate 4-monooxygenase cytochrome P450 [Trichophyton equinum CBS 127.97]|uniref:Benzoate 4-monooxygenase cytochrome P450 n=1 Tax=Trichophyton equinum (strain ATCC MYA-4606 / CBS 127.97) TaxID=559882 RepID=F2PQW9_TRIEC|nr:benzoate 4-monooxygenase cytochrome P450 [Trichophyton equinum CBS 127.97]